MTFVEFPEGELPPKEVALMLGYSTRQVTNLVQKGLIKSKRYYVPGLQPLWSIYESGLIGFIESNVPREQLNIQNFQKRINKQLATHKRLKEKYS